METIVSFVFIQNSQFQNFRDICFCDSLLFGRGRTQNIHQPIDLCRLVPSPYYYNLIADTCRTLILLIYIYKQINIQQNLGQSTVTRFDELGKPGEISNKFRLELSSDSSHLDDNSRKTLLYADHDKKNKN